MAIAPRPGWRDWLACTSRAARRAAFWSFVAAVPTVLIEELITDAYYPGGRPPMLAVWLAQVLYVSFMYFFVAFPVVGAAFAIKHFERHRKARAEPPPAGGGPAP